MDSNSILTRDFARVADAWLFRENEHETTIDPPDNSGGGGLAGEDHKHDYDDPPETQAACDPPSNSGGG